MVASVPVSGAGMSLDGSAGTFGRRRRRHRSRINTRTGAATVDNANLTPALDDRTNNHDRRDGQHRWVARRVHPVDRRHAQSARLRDVATSRSTGRPGRRAATDSATTSRAACAATGASATVSGLVTGHTTAPRGDMDGVVLDFGAGVHSPPHVGAPIAAFGAIEFLVFVPETAPSFGARAQLCVRQPVQADPRHGQRVVFAIRRAWPGGVPQ